jgi:hypothetical protein
MLILENLTDSIIFCNLALETTGDGLRETSACHPYNIKGTNLGFP